jgi:hypothetical protein
MKQFLVLCSLCAWAAGCTQAQSTLDTIGVTSLQAQDPALTGSGVNVMQVEAEPGAGQFEVNPGSPGQPVKLFTYRSALGSSGTFPNKVGSESTHADQVAENFYGENTGVAPGLHHVGNYEVFFFYAAIIQALEPVTARVFNQSFEFSAGTPNASEEHAYDDYIAQYHTVVPSGIGNGGPVLTPADCYNGLGVAAYGGASSTGPTADGRSKPDITAPASFTSFSTPLVSGAAAILIQGGRRLGVNAAAAVDSRTVKALLLTGAVKPADWTHTDTTPLDPNYGAGVLNVFNSYQELAGGRNRPSASGLSGAGHAPLTSGTVTNAASGWDYRGIASSATEEGVSHYRIVTTGTGALITTLAWNKGYRRTAINRLDLFVYDAAGDLLAQSISAVDNVQHIYLTGLGPGAYEIEVVKTAGPLGVPGVVSAREVYALAWDFDR